VSHDLPLRATGLGATESVHVNRNLNVTNDSFKDRRRSQWLIWLRDLSEEVNCT